MDLFQTPGELDQRLAHLAAPVRLVFFSQTFGCDDCLPARHAVDRVAGASKHVSVDEVNLVLDRDRVAAFGVDRAPAVAVVGARDLGIRYYGVPAGYELASLVEAVHLAGSGELDLAAETRTQLAALERAIDIKVFVTPTCVYCPQAVTLAYRFAAASARVTAAAIEATSFPDLARIYQVTGVPKTVVNETREILGTPSEAEYLAHVLAAATETPPA